MYTLKEVRHSNKVYFQIFFNDKSISSKWCYLKNYDKYIKNLKKKFKIS
jgi:hypothetical protein